MLWTKEIRDEPALRVLGIGLAGVHILTYKSWYGSETLSKYLNDPARVCWSFWQSCDTAPWFSAETLNVYFLFYLLLAILTAGLFVFRSTVRVACLFLGLLTLLKASFLIHDYRLMGNYHYMPMWMTAAFLLSPRKREVCTLLLVLFYFAAGLLKLNPEWLSGAAMISPPMVQGKLLEWLTAAVVILELFLVFWILSKKLWKRFAALLALTCFHAFSWHIVGFFYPSVMACMLAFVFMQLPTGTKISIPPSKWPRAWAWLAFPAVFMICQILPPILWQQSAVTGEGRLLSLNMFDAKTICQADILMKKKTEWIELPPLITDLGVRIHCDPQIFLAQAKAYCNLLAGKEQPEISVRVVSRTTTDRTPQTALNQSDVCGNPPRLTWWGAIR